MDLLIDKTYRVNSSRKGVFSMRITSQNREFVTGIIVEGVAGAIMEYNILEEGESVTVRKDLCQFKLLD